MAAARSLSIPGSPRVVSHGKRSPASTAAAIRFRGEVSAADSAAIMALVAATGFFTAEEVAIAGADKKWIWADAKIVGKNKIEVWSPNISQPLAVRYAFNSNPKNPNLTNNSGLPASPFRTDNWPDPTAGKR